MTENHEEQKVSESKRTFNEELEVQGNQLVDRVQQIIKQGNVRKIIIRSADDRVLLETSLTMSAVAGSALALTGTLVPVAVLGVIAAAVAKVKIEIVRELTDEDDVLAVSRKKIEIDVEE